MVPQAVEASWRTGTGDDHITAKTEASLRGTVGPTRRSLCVRARNRCFAGIVITGAQRRTDPLRGQIRETNMANRMTAIIALVLLDEMRNRRNTTVL